MLEKTLGSFGAIFKEINLYFKFVRFEETDKHFISQAALQTHSMY